MTKYGPDSEQAQAFRRDGHGSEEHEALLNLSYRLKKLAEANVKFF